MKYIIVLVFFCAWQAPLFAQSPGHLIHLSDQVASIDADNVYPFNSGYAVIQKGDAQALIDQEGKIVIPYKVYRFESHLDRRKGFIEGMMEGYGFRDGFSVVVDEKTKKMGLLNTDLTLSISCIYYSMLRGLDNPFVYAKKKGELAYEDYILDYSGKIRKSGRFFSNYTWDAIQPTILDATGLYGYTDALENVLIKPAFHKANSFSDGLAAVSKIDEFGKAKWGYIDTAGEVVIPFNFSNMPGKFHDGLALIEPLVKDDFEYAYIDKKGNIAFLIKKQGNFQLYRSKGHIQSYNQRESGAFVDGFSIWYAALEKRDGRSNLMLVDKNGTYYRYIDLLQKSSWNSPHDSFLTDFIDGEAILSSYGGAVVSRMYAIANQKGEIIIRTSMNEGEAFATIDSLFDPVSGLAKVTLYKSHDDWKGRSGYANRKGEIVILMAEKSIW